MALHLKSVTKHYNGFLALEEISFSVQELEFVCIVGPSGCGKSTILRIIAGLETITSGSVEFDDGDLRIDNGDIGFVFQDDTLFPWLNVRKNIAFGLELKKVGRSEKKKIVDYFLDLVGLKEFSRHYPHQLSGGMKQKAQIARAMAYNPKMLLMDEPFASIDAQTRNAMQEQVLEIWSREKKSVIFVTHSLDEAIYLADRIICLGTNPGRVNKIIDVDLKRPRKRTSEEFNALRKIAYELIKA